MRFSKLASALTCTGLMAMAAPAYAADYNLSWTGPDGYTLTGFFSFDDSLLGQIIEENDLTAFRLEGFDPSGNSVGTWDLFQDGLNNDPDFNFNVFNFNFDSQSETFLLGCVTSTCTGQYWYGNSVKQRVGFASGTVEQWLAFDGKIVDNLENNFVTNPSASRLTSTVANRGGNNGSTAAIPEPTTIFGIGLAGASLAAVKRKQRKAKC